MAEQTPGWHPDPSGRHQHRFWNGTTWTDEVADNGHTASDSLAHRPGVPGEGAASPPPQPRSRSARRWPLAVAAVAAVAAAVVIGGSWLLLGGGDSSSITGRTIIDAKPGTVSTRTVHLHAGEAVGFEVRAKTKEARFRVAIATDGRAAKALVRTFGREGTDAYPTAEYSAFFGADRGDRRLLYAGHSRGSYALSLVAPATGTYVLAVRPDKDARLRLDVETERKAHLADHYSPIDLYKLRRDGAYQRFFASWDKRSQGDVGAFRNFSDPYSDQGSGQSGSDYYTTYSDYLSESGTSS